jgi:glycine cleavage system H protein
VKDSLEFTLDKFTFKVAADRFYSPEGVWARDEAGRIRVGLSDYLQQRSGDIAFVQIAPPGSELASGDALADVETIKVDVSLACPVAGKVMEVNPSLEQAPEAINQDPYGEGWLALVEATDWPADRASLLDPQAYSSRFRRKLRRRPESNEPQIARCHRSLQRDRQVLWHGKPGSRLPGGRNASAGNVPACGSFVVGAGR